MGHTSHKAGLQLRTSAVQPHPAAVPGRPLPMQAPICNQMSLPTEVAAQLRQGTAHPQPRQACMRPIDFMCF